MATQCTAKIVYCTNVTKNLPLNFIHNAMICLGPTIFNTIMNNDIDGIGNMIISDAIKLQQKY